MAEHPVLALLLGLVLGGGVALWFGGQAVGEVTTHLDNTGNVETTDAEMVTVDYFETGNPETDLWRVEMRYTYTVDGTRYNGSTLYSDGKNTVGRERRADRFVENHPPNSTVQVYYRSADPSQSYVIQRSLWTVVSRTLVNVVFVGIGLLVAGAGVSIALEGE